MSQARIQPTGVERTFAEDEIIVSKTDLTGRITYANDVFQRVSGFTTTEIIGQPHSFIRHPDMPRAVFKQLWDAIQGGRECFAYVVNLCKDGGHYWVLAHLTPSFDVRGTVTGFHSNRRVPDREAVREAQTLYADLRRIESQGDRRDAVAASHQHLLETLQARGESYDEWVWGLANGTHAGAAR